MNGIDLSTASDIRLGGTTVSAVYLGSTLIWPATHNYANDYFTIESLEDNNSFRFVKDPTSQVTTDATIYYSLDEGINWTTYEATDNNATYITINTGKTILLKSDLAQLDFYIESTKTFNTYGNLHSLLYLDSFASNSALPSNFKMTGLFKGSNIVSAENLILPATILTKNCYYEMFANCTSMITAPVLPATTLANDCYDKMFNSCTSLTTAPELSATTLANYCYDGMFSDCTSLVNAPVLPATTLTKGCYRSMFSNCTSLVSAPVLPATTLTVNCYNSMFFYCSSLNNITCLATDISANYCTIDWVWGVASTGTFTKAASMTNWLTNDSGIPSGWTVQDA